MTKRVVDAVLRRGQKLLPRKRAVILMYHRVAEESFDPWGLAVHPRRFEQHMALVAEQRETLALSEFIRRHRQGLLSEDALAVTFDDGYACVAKVAAPILKQFAIPATVFIPSELIRREREFWWDDLERIVRLSGQDQLTLGATSFDLGRLEAGDRSWRPGDPPSTSRQRAFLVLWSKLKVLPTSVRQATLEELRVQAGIFAEARESHRPMTPCEARELASGSIEFGSHALTHPDLPSLQHDEAAAEVGESMDDCAELVGERPRAFAYPYGRYDRRSERLAKQAGFECACTAAPGFVRGSSNRFALPRLAVGDWDAATFQRKLLGG
jgi:peptidoglycan/xylan/chitin deacetylase (PgdA/CDA1 family)